MTRQEYVEKRKALVAEAEAYANEGNRESFEAKKAEIEALDQKYEQEARARANTRAQQKELRDQLVDLVGRQVGGGDALDPEIAVQGGTVVDRLGEPAWGARWNLRPSADRGKRLKAMNAVKLTSEGVLVPTRFSTELSPTFNQVSSLIDRVRVFNRLGGESFQHSYVREYGEGAEVADDAAYQQADPEFGLVGINKAKITAYSEEDEGVLKLPDADYDAEVVQGVRIALRRRITRQILIGDGSTNKLTGIFNSTYDPMNPTKGAIDPATDKSIAAINDGTLDEIIFSYGGEEDVEDGAVLILNKADLKAFAQLRDGNGNRVHTIHTQGNTGMIDGVQYVINGTAKPLATAVAGDYCMAYGYPTAYGLAIFSDIDVQRSNDFKFNTGQIAHRGSVYVGGNVIRWNGFLRVKKA